MGSEEPMSGLLAIDAMAVPCDGCKNGSGSSENSISGVQKNAAAPNLVFTAQNCMVQAFYHRINKCTVDSCMDIAFPA